MQGVEEASVLVCFVKVGIEGSVVRKWDRCLICCRRGFRGVYVPDKFTVDTYDVLTLGGC